jgi:membrane protease YdiL (CAAX protease family)
MKRRPNPYKAQGSASQANVTDNPPRLRFNVACYFEVGLLIVALLLGILFDYPLADHLAWNLNDLLLGALAAIPPLVVILGLTHSGWHVFGGLKRVVEIRIRPLFVGWTWWQLGVLSILAGIAEECFFRGLIQGGLVNAGGMLLGILAASVFFGMAHLLTNAYGIMAALIGAYLGALLVWKGNLMIPITTHAVYDFAALGWIMRKKP